MSNKISYPILALQIEKLYQKKFPDDNELEIERHIKYIADYIKACGWDEEEFLNRWMKEQEESFN